MGSPPVLGRTRRAEPGHGNQEHRGCQGRSGARGCRSLPSSLPFPHSARRAAAAELSRAQPQPGRGRDVPSRGSAGSQHRAERSPLIKYSLCSWQPSSLLPPRSIASPGCSPRAAAGRQSRAGGDSGERPRGVRSWMLNPAEGSYPNRSCEHSPSAQRAPQGIPAVQAAGKGRESRSPRRTRGSSSAARAGKQEPRSCGLVQDRAPSSSRLKTLCMCCIHHIVLVVNDGCVKGWQVRSSRSRDAAAPGSSSQHHPHRCLPPTWRG